MRRTIAFALYISFTACHPDEDSSFPTAPAQVTSDRDNRPSVERTHGAFEQAFTTANELIDMWNSTSDKASARRRLSQLTSDLLTIKENLVLLPLTTCGLDHMKNIHDKLDRMKRHFSIYLTTDDTKDLVNANEAKLAAERAIEKYDETCGQN